MYYTTYGIADPRTKLIRYVGQTNDFERQKQEHLRAHRVNRPRRGDVKYWLKSLNKARLKPLFIVLEIVETNEASLASENLWVEKLADLGHPLYNRWDEHKDMIEAADQTNARTLEPKLFGKGRVTTIGSCEPNANKTGYRLHLKKGLKLDGPVTIDLVPKRKKS